jgi:hypothetical protein
LGSSWSTEISNPLLYLSLEYSAVVPKITEPSLALSKIRTTTSQLTTLIILLEHYRLFSNIIR